MQYRQRPVKCYDRDRVEAEEEAEEEAAMAVEEVEENEKEEGWEGDLIEGMEVEKS